MYRFMDEVIHYQILFNKIEIKQVDSNFLSRAFAAH